MSVFQTVRTRLFTLSLCVMFLAEIPAMSLRIRDCWPELKPVQVQVDSCTIVKYSVPVLYWSISFLSHVDIFN